MTLSKFNLQKSMLNFSKSKEDSASVLSGVLGLNLETVQVPNRAGFVYVRLRDNLHEVIEAYNGVVSPVYNLPVLLRWDKTRYMIVGRDLERYVSWGTTSSYLPLHGASHAFSESGAGDVVWVYSRQFMPWLITPSGSSAADSGMVQGYPYYFESRWKYLATTGTPSLIGNKPTGSLGARMSLLYLDQKENIMKLTAGTIEFDASLTGTADIMPYVPAIAQDWHIPLAGVRVVTGTATISWGNLYDLRPHFTSPPTGTGGGGADLTGFTDGSIIFVESEEAAEDNDNLFYDNANNTLFLGGAGTPAPILSSNTREIIQGDGGTGPEIRTANDAAYPYLITARARGNLASPTAVVSGDVLARINHYGYDGSAYVDKARHDVFATEDWSTNARGTKIQVRTTPTGTAGTNAVAEWEGTGLSLLKGIRIGQLVETDSDYVMDGEDCVVILSPPTESNRSITLPPATNKSQTIFIKAGTLEDASLIWVTQGSDTVEGLASGTFINSYDYYMMIADGTDTWYIFSSG